jgi:hypothetical protein
VVERFTTTQYFVRYGAVSLAAPAVRMVVVETWAKLSEGHPETDHMMIPVVAVRCVVAHEYSKSHTFPEGPSHQSASHRELVKLGWVYGGCSVENEVLVVDGGAVVPLSDVSRGSTHLVHQVAACPWLAAEDGVRLEDVIASGKLRAVAKAEDFAEQTKTPAY